MLVIKMSKLQLSCGSKKSHEAGSIKLLEEHLANIGSIITGRH